MRAAFLIATIVFGAAAYSAQPIAIGSIHFYQRHFAAFADRAGAKCRFSPTCSHYAEIVITRDGVWRGGWKTLARVARCGPWTANGTRDDPNH